MLGYLIAPILLLVCLVAPNSQELVDRVTDSSMERLGLVRRDYVMSLYWQPNLRWAVAVGLMFYIATVALTKNSEFVYFQF